MSKNHQTNESIFFYIFETFTNWEWFWKSQWSSNNIIEERWRNNFKYTNFCEQQNKVKTYKRLKTYTKFNVRDFHLWWQFNWLKCDIFLMMFVCATIIFKKHTFYVQNSFVWNGIWRPFENFSRGGKEIKNSHKNPYHKTLEILYIYIYIKPKLPNWKIFYNF